MESEPAAAALSLALRSLLPGFSGVMPNPPDPGCARNMTHMPQPRLLSSCGRFKATVTWTPFVQGKELKLAEFSLNEHAPWWSWSGSWP